MTPSPTQGHEPRGLFSWNLRRPSKVPKFQIWCLCEEWLLRYKHLKNFNTVWRERERKRKRKRKRGRPGWLQ